MLKNQKITITLLLLSDVIIIAIAYMISCYIRFDTYEFSNYIGIILKNLPLAMVIYIGVLGLFKMYNRIWRIAGIDEVIYGGFACFIGIILNYTLMEFMVMRTPRTVTVLAGILITIGVIGVRISSRTIRRILQQIREHTSDGKENILIIGGGDCAQLIITEIIREKSHRYNIVGLIDDDKNKINRYLKGYKILGNRYKIEKVVKENEVHKIIIAIPSMDNEARKEIVEICNRTKVKVKVIPAIHELIDGKVKLNLMRDVDLKDLLGRPQVKLDKKGISEYITGKRVLVTGAGGSIGSELCRQIAVFNPSKLIMVDIYENNIYEIQNQLNWQRPDLNKAVIIGSVRDKSRLEEIFQRYKPNLVFHAAAHKHVPLMEDSPSEAIKNNVCGTYNMAQGAHKYGVERFVLISTDKAVNSTNVMGATKRMCEIIIQGMDKISETEFVAVRFGNVLGSNGSVIPLFKEQIKQGGPITLTHSEITRYFMLIPEAAQLVLQAGAFAKGGEIFILDMGNPVKIYDLAENLIKLSGLKPHEDIEIKITGLRPGEKLYEELLMDEEGITKTNHEKIFIGKPQTFEMQQVNLAMGILLKACETGNKAEIKRALKSVVKTYKDSEEYNAIKLYQEVAMETAATGE